MLVDDATFAKLRADAVEKAGRRTPSPRNMVALKLHAAKSVGRAPEKSAQDWQDIRKIVQLHKLDPADDAFAARIIRYGGEEARRMCETYKACCPKDDFDLPVFDQPMQDPPCTMTYEQASRAFEEIIANFRLREEPRPVEDIPAFIKM